MTEPISGIYPILDVGAVVPPEHAPEVLDKILAGGARWVQLRAKTVHAGPFLALARVLLAKCHERGARLVINDRPDVALLAGADGVHLGQDDLPAAEVRRWLPPAMIIGVSCHNVDQVSAALTPGVASYLAIGPIFDTTSKDRPDPVVGVEGLARARSLIGSALPLIAIGGITIGRLAAVRGAGADGAAMIAGLLKARDIEAATRTAIETFR